MTKYNYSAELKGTNMAKAVARDVAVSQKQAIETCNFIRGKNTIKAKQLLQRIFEHKDALPMKRFNKGGTGHKPGIGPGRYPEKTVARFIDLINSVEANAKDKGLNSSSLVINHANAQQGTQRYHNGRLRRSVMKRTHIEIMVTEIQEKEEKAEAAKPKKETKRTASKK